MQRKKPVQLLCFWLAVLLAAAVFSGRSHPVATASPIIFEVQVDTSSDDAEEANNGTVSLTSSDLELVDGQTVGIRFTNVGVPSQATITAAYIQFQVDESDSEATSLTIAGQAADHAPTFSSNKNDVSGRPRTAATVNWSPPAWEIVGEAGPDQQTTDLSAVIQEIIDRPDWSYGNALAFIITGAGVRTAEAFNGVPEAAPLLHVEYTGGVVPTVTPTATTATITVPADYPTIQAAINAANTGDTVIVRAGTYQESLVLDKAITLTAEFYDPQNPANNATIIDGGGAASVIEIPPDISPMPTLRGFVIQNGSSDGITPRSPFLVEYCYFTGAGDLIDYEAGSGGITRHNLFFDANDDAIDLDNQTKALLIEHNRILYSGQDGLEIRLQDGSAPPQLIDITIRHNEIIGSGEDGIQFIDYPNDPQDTNRRFLIHNNLFANNQMAAIGLMPDTLTSEDYSGADVIEAIRVYNNTFYGNDYALSGGDNLVAFNNIIANTTTLGVSRVQGNPGDNSVVAYTLFFDNGTDASESFLGTGNLFGQDPLFVSSPMPGPDGQFGTLDDDFSELILQDGSPAIDAGVTQFTAADGELIPSSPITIFNGLAPDFGWQENIPSMPPTETSTPSPTDTPSPTNTPTIGPTPTSTFTPLPTNTATATVPPSDTPTPSPTDTPTATSTPTDTPTAVPPSIHVGDLDGSAENVPRGVWAAHVTITVHDNNHSPLANVEVSGVWSGGTSGSASCSTDGNGRCTLIASDIPKREKTVTFTVVDVVDSNRPYQPADNHDPDNDSDGTAIVVTR